MPVSSTLRYTFDVAKLDELAPGKPYFSRSIPVFHKDVAINFYITLNPNQTEDYADFLGVFLRYKDGPKEKVVVNLELLVVSDTGPVSLGKLTDRRLSRKGEGYGFLGRKLPRSVEALAAGGFLKSRNTLLEIEAIVTIPNDAFDSSDGFREVLRQTGTSQRDPFRRSLFKQLGTPVPTNEPFSERFELRAIGGSFWAHKSVLAFSSEVFKGWLFHPEKPPEDQSTDFNNGELNVNLSKDALWHILHFIYLEETAKGFSKYAFEIVETAERFRFKELKRICERSLLGGLDSMAMDSLFESLKVSDTFGLAQLKTATANKLIEELNGEGGMAVENQEEFLLSLIEYSKQHEHTALKRRCDAKLAETLQLNVDTTKFLSMVSNARKHDLDELSKWCAKWMAKNYQMFKDEGHLTRLVTNQSENAPDVMEFMMQSFSNLVGQLLD